MPGQHRKPSHAARNLAAITASGALAVVPLAPAPAAAAELDVNWQPLIQCESGGNPTVQNAHSTASGLFQFLDSTWRALGGTEYAPRAKDASPAEQQQVADRAYQRSGLRPWDASRHCWAGRGVDGPAPRRVAPAPAQAPAGEYVVRAGDTLAGIAAAHGVTWQQLWAGNRTTVPNPSRIFVGQRLRLPGVTGSAPTPAPVAPASPARQLRIELTGYSWQDNTPPGSATVSHPIVHKAAGGTGTYADPITVAVPSSGKGMYPAGTRFYLPTVHRYVIVEDTGASPASAGVDAHLDMWIDGRDGTRAATDACMDQITGTVAAELNPPQGRPVTAGPVYAGGCHI